MALTKVSGDILDTGIVVAGIVTATEFVGAGLSISGISTFVGVATFKDNAYVDKELYVGGIKINSGGGTVAIGTDIITRNLKATGVSTFVGDAQFDGDVSIGGTLTYQDVTNIDSVGLGTFRNGIHVTAGVSTFLGGVKIGPTNTNNRYGLINIGGAGALSYSDNDGSSGNMATVLLENTYGAANSDIHIKQRGDLEVQNLQGNAILRVDTSWTSALVNSGNVYLNYKSNTSGSSVLTRLSTTSTGVDIDTGDLHMTGGGQVGIADTIFHLGDTNTKIRFPAADTFAVETAGNERLRITSGGSIGQGTGTPRTPDGSNADNPLNGDGTNGNPVFTIYGDSPAINLVSSTTASGDYSLINFGRTGSSSNPYRAVIGYKQSDDILRINAQNAITFDTGGNINTGERLRITSAGNLKLPDNAKIELGGVQTGSGDLSIWHNTSHSLIKNTTGRLYLLSDDLWIKNEADNKTAARFFEGNEVFLYHNDTVRLTTTSTGITVTGEVAASQDYPNYRPTLDFNFAAVKKLDPRITYSRTGPASYTDEFGIVKLVGGNAPRFDHDPVTKESKGLLIEEARTNQWLQSVTLADYVTGGNLQQSTLADAGTSTKDPAGGYNATKMAATANAGAHSFYKNFTSGSNTNNHTFSVWVKAAGVDYARIYVDTVGGNLGGPGVTFSTGNTWNVAASGVGTQVATSAVEYPNGWWRLSVTGNFSNRNDYYCHVDLEGGEGDISFTGNGSNGMYVWGAQFENGDLSTSYIPTYGTTVTRAVDYAIIDGTEFSDFYNQSEGTLLSEFTINDRAHADELTSGAIANINALSSDSYANSIMFMEIGTANGYFGRVYKDSNGRQLSYGSSVIADIMGGNTNRVSFAWSDTVVNQGLAAYWNGSVVDTEANEDKTPTNMTELRIGQGWGSSHINAHIKKLSYYPKRLPNSQLATLTA